jgi:hypothetical protein
MFLISASLDLTLRIYVRYETQEVSILSLSSHTLCSHESIVHFALWGVAIKMIFINSIQFNS